MKDYLKQLVIKKKKLSKKNFQLHRWVFKFNPLQSVQLTLKLSLLVGSQRTQSSPSLLISME